MPFLYPTNLQKFTTLPLCILTTLVMIAYAYFVMGGTSQCFHIEGEINSLGLQFGYTYQQVLDFFSQRDEAMLRCYQSFLAIYDIIFPVIYTLMYVGWIVFLFKGSRVSLVSLLAIPILHCIVDWLENCLEIQMVHQYLTSDKISESLVKMGSIVTSTKWVLSTCTYVIILWGITLVIMTFIKHRRNSR